MMCAQGGTDQTGGASAPVIMPIADSEERLHQFLVLLAKWNRVYNLTAITDPTRMWTHHVLDSLSIVPLVDTLLARSNSRRVLDAGSGAGLPGIPLAIVRPEWELTLVDSSSKKTAFVTQAIAELGLSNVTPVTARIEAFAGRPFAVITARAFASLNDYIGSTRHLLAPDGAWVAMKGGLPEQELRGLSPDIECAEVISLEVPGLDARRHALVLKVKAG